MSATFAPADVLHEDRHVRLTAKPERLGFARRILYQIVLLLFPFAVVPLAMNALHVRVRDEWIPYIVVGAIVLELLVVAVLAWRPRLVGYRRTLQPAAVVAMVTPPSFTGTIEVKSESQSAEGRAVVLRVLEVYDADHVDHVFLRSVSTSEFWLRTDDGRRVLVVGSPYLKSTTTDVPLELAPFGEWGECLPRGARCKARLSTLSPGDAIAVWGVAADEQRTDGYRDEKVSALRSRQDSALVIAALNAR